MKNQGKVLASGEWHHKRDCPVTPAKFADRAPGLHSFKQTRARYSCHKNFKLLTFKCVWCNGMIVDYPQYEPHH